MKLVDILAGGLKDWPEGVAGITQGPGSGVLFDSSYQGFGRDIYLPVADDAGSPASCVKPGVTVSRAEWQAAVDALNAPKVVEWDGEGEPPVGIECEWHPNVHGWVKVKILGRDGSDTWYRAVGEEHSQTCRNMAFFRPIRTAEQVAAEEREKAIREMASTPKPCGHALYNVCADLYDAGYRKQVAK